MSEQGKMASIPVSLLQKMVGTIEKAGAYISQIDADLAQVKKAAPEAVETLVRQGLIQPEQREAAIEKLASSHSTVMETLRRTATHVKPASLGAPAAAGEAKQASAGASATAQADAQFLERMGF